MTAVLRHNRYPEFRIIDPDSRVVTKFSRISDTLGVLIINEDDPAYENVMRVARADPSITIEMTGILTCAECSEVFTGKMAKARLGKHQKDTGHTGSSESGEKVQQGNEFVCPVDSLPFKSEGALVKHTQDVHAPKAPEEPFDPDLSGGSVVQGTLGTSSIPAAKRTGG